jgi:hypothetical protein
MYSSVVLGVLKFKISYCILCLYYGMNKYFSFSKQISKFSYKWV